MLNVIKKLHQKLYKKGFTLLELLVVVLIIGILAAIALPRYQRAKEKAIMTEGMQIAKQIAEANQRYYLIHGEYSNDINNLDIEFTGEQIIITVKRIVTNNFTLSTRGSSSDEISVAQRNPAGKKYYIRITNNNPNKFSCYAGYSDSTQIQKELCNKLNRDGHL